MEMSSNLLLKKLRSEPDIKIDKINELSSILNMSEEDRNKRIESKFLKKLEHANNFSRFYRNLFQKYNIQLSDITCMEDIQKLPFTVKEDVREQYPFGMLASEISEIARYGESTGTTGNPTSAYFSREDWFENNVFVAYRVSDLFSPEDVAVIAAPYELSVPAQDYERIYELIGTTVISCGVLNEVCPWEKIIDIIVKCKPTVLICSGTRTLLLGEMAKKMGYIPEKDFTIKKILNVGDTINDAKGKKIRELWGAEVFNAYGMTEACALAISCPEGNIHIFNDRYYFEVIDPETLHPVPEGEKGELVITSLGNKSMPLFRYRTGDLVSISWKQCGCSCRTPVINHYGRCDNIIEIVNTKISYFELEEGIMDCEAQNILYKVFYDNYSIEITFDLKEGFTKDDLKEQLLKRFSKKIVEHIVIRVFSEKEREDYYQFLKDSIKPFSKIFNKKV